MEERLTHTWDLLDLWNELEELLLNGKREGKAW
jgi:hypothetical protein